MTGGDISSVGTLTATTVTDGTASITGGDISSVGTLTADTITDGTASITGGDISDVGTLTATTVTDGTVTLTAGELTGTLDISGATVTYRSIVNGDITDNTIARSKLAENALQKFGVPFQSLRNDDGTVMDATGGAGLFAITAGGFGTGTLTIDGEAASAGAKTDILQFEFILPPQYVSQGDVKLVLTAKESVGAATASTTLSSEVYESNGEGDVSAVSGSWDKTDVTAAWQTFTNTLTATALAAGDRLIVLVRIVTNDTGGTVGTVAQIGKIELQCDIKG